MRAEHLLGGYRESPLRATPKVLPDGSWWALAEVEIDLALGRRERAFAALIARLEVPEIRDRAEYVPALNLAAALLEARGEPVPAMAYAERAIRAGGAPEDMAEAGARWLRIARHQGLIARRPEMFALFLARGGDRAPARFPAAAEAAYEVAFVHRTEGQRDAARAALARIPPDSAYASRATYLRGVLDLEAGDVEGATRTFGELKDTPLPAGGAPDLQDEVERAVRRLATLAFARLAFARGDLDTAGDAYRAMRSGEARDADVCLESTFLDLERGRNRGALAAIDCAVARTPSGLARVHLRAVRAAVLAELERYDESLDAFEALEREVEAARARFVAVARSALDARAEGAEFLFATAEREALRPARTATGAPEDPFSDAWTPAVDLAYRVDRGAREAETEAENLGREGEALELALEREETSPQIVEVRRRALEALASEVRAMLVEATDLGASLRGAEASAAGGASPTRVEEATAISRLVERLEGVMRGISDELEALDQWDAARRAQARRTLGAVRRALASIFADLADVEFETRAPADAVAARAIADLAARLGRAAVGVEAGELDTYWIRKEHLTRRIDAAILEKKRRLRELDRAMDEVDDDPSSGPGAAFEQVDGALEGAVDDAAGGASAAPPTR